jgi:hypothetical protein
LVLKWEARREDIGKHGKFDPIWFDPYKISASQGNNYFLLENLDGNILNALVNG